MTLLHTVIVASFLVVGYCNTYVAINAVDDVHRQEGNLHKCWEPIDDHDRSLGHHLSEAVYPYCQYIWANETSFFVRGAEYENDSLQQIDPIVKERLEDRYAITMVCLQEAFSFGGPHRPSQFTFRCLCARDGCNTPQKLSKMIEYNKQNIIML